MLLIFDYLAKKSKPNLYLYGSIEEIKNGRPKLKVVIKHLNSIP
jgi:hypothetical protein